MGNGKYLMDPNPQEQPSTASFSGSNDVKQKSQSQNQDFSFPIGLWPQPDAISITPNGAMTPAPHMKGEFISLEKVQDWTRTLSFPGFTTAKRSSTLGWLDEKENFWLKHYIYSNYNESIPKQNI